MRWPASSYMTSQCMNRDLTFWLQSPPEVIIFSNLRREQVWRPWKSLKCKIWIYSGKNLLGQINPVQKCYFSNLTTLLNWISTKGKGSQKTLWGNTKNSLTSSFLACEHQACHPTYGCPIVRWKDLLVLNFPELYVL